MGIKKKKAKEEGEGGKGKFYDGGEVGHKKKRKKPGDSETASYKNKGRRRQTVYESRDKR